MQTIKHKIQDGWMTKRVDEVAMRVLKRAGINSTPYIEIGDIDTETKSYFIKDKPAPGICVQAKVNDILVSKVRPTRGAITNIQKDVFVSPAFSVLRTINDDSDYLFYSLCREDFLRYLGSIETGTTYPSCDDDDIASYEISIPPTQSEQKKISEIISSMDSVIRKTNMLIEKYKRSKAGMMQDFFRYGIDDKGKIRNEKTHKFKKSPLGDIPVEWNYDLLDTLGERGSGHTPNKSHPEYWNGGIKWVSLADTYRLDDLHIQETEYQISAVGIKHSSAVLHPAGTVIISRDAGVGKSAIMSEPMAVSQHFIVWRCSERLNNYYLYYWLQKDKRTFEAIASGSTIVTIGLSFFKNYRIPFPTSIAEQERIVKALMRIELLIKKEIRYLSKLKQVKNGLMNDLLTGAVRVNH